jgi:hypothetical protein
MAVTSFLAGEDISQGDAVYVDTNGFVYKACGQYLNQASVVGVAIDAGTLGRLIRIATDNIYNGFSGQLPGEYKYLSILTSGQLVSYSGWQSEFLSTGYDSYLTVVGRAVTTSGLAVESSTPTVISNPSQFILLQSSTGLDLDAILLEDGSTSIELESATP